MSATAQEQPIARLCDECAASAKRNHVSLCATCSEKFRVIFLPIECRSFSEVAEEARSEAGADCEELVRGMMLRIFNQQRELAKLNFRISDMTRRLVSALARDGKLEPIEVIDAATQVIRRYNWLRNGNAFMPEECRVEGGDELDRVIDEAIRIGHGVTA